MLHCIAVFWVVETTAHCSLIMGRGVVKYLSWRQWEHEPLTQLQQGAGCEEDVGGWREDAGAGLWSHWSHTGERMLVSSHTGHTLERGCWSLVTLMVDLSPCRGQLGLLLVRVKHAACAVRAQAQDT